MRHLPRCLEQPLFSNPPDLQIAGALVDKLAYRLSGPNNSFVAAELGAVSLPSLQQALGALLPPDRQLRALTLVISRVSPYAVQHCPRLQGLTELALNDVECEWGSLEALLGELVDWAPGLARLHLQSTSSSHRFNDRLHIGQLPPEVEALQGLTALGISGHPVGYFPPGAYLSGGVSEGQGCRLAVCVTNCTAVSLVPLLPQLLPDASLPCFQNTSTNHMHPCPL